ncbi:MAG: glycoside hydrolase family 25 protein [Rhizobiaceae bacterium]|nr:glycoside hydrolase family 25 protein [Rhizobiaceae bacterium]
MPLNSVWKFGILLAAGALCACSTVDDMMPDGKYSAVAGPVTGSIAKTFPRFGDTDPHEWQARTPWEYAVHGTDVSKYQPHVDWQAAREAGISFAFIKATEGGDRVDDKFREHWNNARAAGVPRGAYHFYYFCRPAAEQAAWFIRNVPREKGALPPILDMEWNPDSPSCKLRPPAETVRREMKIFLDIVERHYGKKPVIYTSIDFFDDNNLSTFHGYRYWLRSVAGHPSEKYGSHPFTFWQYTGTGVVPGIRGKVDINVFNGTHREWKQWVAQNAH